MFDLYDIYTKLLKFEIKKIYIPKKMFSDMCNKAESLPAQKVRLF